MAHGPGHSIKCSVCHLSHDICGCNRELRAVRMPRCSPAACAGMATLQRWGDLRAGSCLLIDAPQLLQSRLWMQDFSWSRPHWCRLQRPMRRPLLLQYSCIGASSLQRCYRPNQPGWIHQRPGAILCSDIPCKITRWGQASRRQPPVWRMRDVHALER